MDVATIEVSRFQAREAYQDYRKAVREGRATDEDRVLLSAYREIVRGEAVLSIIDVMRNVGVDEQLRPRLAVCRADVNRCWFTPNSYRHTGRPVFSDQSWPVASYVRKNIVLSRGTFPRLGGQSVSCVVPTIPPALRPPDLSKYYVLWEADWDEPPVDPVLLRWIRGPFYAVVATWDLTELEQSIIGAR